MKVRTLLEKLEQLKQKYPDFEDWEVYTEQSELQVPENFLSLDEEKQRIIDESKKYNAPFNQEYWDYLIKSDERINTLKKAGWKFVFDSEGWVYRDIAHFTITLDDGTIKETANCTIFEKEKIIAINNNF